MVSVLSASPDSKAAAETERKRRQTNIESSGAEPMWTGGSPLLYFPPQGEKPPCTSAEVFGDSGVFFLAPIGGKVSRSDGKGAHGTENAQKI